MMNATAIAKTKAVEMIAIDHVGKGSSSLSLSDVGGDKVEVPSSPEPSLMMMMALSFVVSIRMTEMFERSETHVSPGLFKTAMYLELSGPKP